MRYPIRNFTAVALMLLPLACGGGSPTSPTPTTTTPPATTPVAPASPVSVSLSVEVSQDTAAAVGPLDTRVVGDRQRRRARGKVRAEAQRRARVNINCGVTIGATTQPFPALGGNDLVVEPPAPLEINAPFTLDLPFPIPSGDLRVGCTATSADTSVQIVVTGGEATFPLASTIPVTSTCTPSPTVVCVGDLRISATAADGGGVPADGQVNARDRYDDGGYFWFFNESNVELLVRVVDRCRQQNRYYLYLEALRDIRSRVVVSATNTATGVTRTYENPAGERLRLFEDTVGLICR